MYKNINRSLRYLNRSAMENLPEESLNPVADHSNFHDDVQVMQRCIQSLGLRSIGVKILRSHSQDSSLLAKLS